jgi:hypothetical protein
MASEPLHPLRSETKGQAAACPDRTRAIPCTARVGTEVARCGARPQTACYVPDRVGNSGGSRWLTGTPFGSLTWRPAGRDSAADDLLSKGSLVPLACH